MRLLILKPLPIPPNTTIQASTIIIIHPSSWIRLNVLVTELKRHARVRSHQKRDVGKSIISIHCHDEVAVVVVDAS